MKNHHRHISDRPANIVTLLGIVAVAILLSACSSTEPPVSPFPVTSGTNTEVPTLLSNPTEAVPPAITATASPIPTTTKPPEPTATFTPTLLPDLIEDEQGVPMVLVPAGSFVMGSDNNQAAAQPAHTVYLDTFYIDQFEVTNERYLACIEAGGCMSGGSSRIRNPAYIGHPVMDVTWYEAKLYCEWRGARLPTEAEWEKAARGTDERTFPWGNEPITCELARYGECGWFTVPVGQYPEGVSPYGAYDMAGNAWEWTNDWYIQDYYTVSPAENPTGPEINTGWKSTRGGAWFYHGDLMTSIWRNQAPPDVAYSYLGFRCARTP